MTTILTYYIDGQEVGENEAQSYYMRGAERSIAMGYCDIADVLSAWKCRAKHEEARELIFNFSAILDEGGLEIIGGRKMSNLELFLALHNPLAQEEHMVYEVWEDGEVTLTKGAELYGCRNLHMTMYAVENCVPFDFNLLPVRTSSHGRIQVMTREEAVLARSYIAVTE